MSTAFKRTIKPVAVEVRGTVEEDNQLVVVVVQQRVMSRKGQLRRFRVGLPFNGGAEDTIEQLVAEAEEYVQDIKNGDEVLYGGIASVPVTEYDMEVERDGEMVIETQNHAPRYLPTDEMYQQALNGQYDLYFAEFDKPEWWLEEHPEEAEQVDMNQPAEKPVPVEVEEDELV